MSSPLNCHSTDMIKCFGRQNSSLPATQSSVQAFKGEIMNAAPRRDRKAWRWALLVRQMMKLWWAMERYITANKVIREFKYRAPALMGFMEAMMQREVQLAEDLAFALPPASTLAKGQTPHALHLQYQTEPNKCPHLVEHGRSYGNKFGKFLECISCGSVWKGLDYQVPITGHMVTTYKIYHGLRDRPGGQVKKGATTRTSSTRSCAYSSSSPPTSMEAAYGTKVTTTSTTSRTSKAKAKVKIEPAPQLESSWDEEEMVVISDEEELKEPTA